ncbi:MAG: pro-sigmaK processing inhibitor BofA family protein [Candidatus Micrarchaeaceae archaeon]
MLNVVFVIFSLVSALSTVIPPLSALGGYILIAILAVILIYIILILGRSMIKFIIGLIVNTILGLIALILLDFVFNFGIPLTLPIIGSTALFGLPGVGAIALLKLLGVISFI